MRIFLSEAKFFFNAQNQREFTSVTSEASFRSKFKLILGIKKIFAELKNVTLNAISIQHVTLFHIFCDC